MDKKRNRSFLIRIQVVKIIFYPMVALFDSFGLMHRLYRPFERVTRALGIEKSMNTFLQYHDFAELFKGNFNDTSHDRKGILLPSFLGVNSSFTIFEMLLAKYYYSKGYEPALVVCNSAISICQKENIIRNRRFNPLFCHECWKGYREIAKKSGLRVHYLGDYRSKEAELRIKKAKMMIRDVKSHKDASGFIFEGVSVGEMTYKSVLRYYLKGSLSETDEELKIFRKFLLSTVTTGILIEGLLESKRGTERVVIPNGTLALEAIIRQHCSSRGIPYMTFENYMGESTVIYKRNDEVMKLSWDEEMESGGIGSVTEKEITTVADRFFSELRVGRHKYAVLNREQDRSKSNKYGRFACAFTNLNFDTAVIGKHTFFRDMEDWLVSLIAFWSSGVTDINLVIRVHPAEVKMRSGTSEFMGDRLRDRIRSEKIFLVDSTEQVNSYDLIEEMQFGLIYSSTIGLEIANMNKTCVVAGKPYFINKPFVVTPSGRDDYFKIISLLTRGEYTFIPDREALCRLVYYNFNVRLKVLHGIRLFSLNAGKVTEAASSGEILEKNRAFFDEFEVEFSGREG